MQFNKASKKTRSTAEETSSAKRHRKATTVSSGPEAPAPAATDPAGAVTSSGNLTASSSREATREEIARLAFSYWIARGYQHGRADEDWFRAERELKSQR